MVIYLPYTDEIIDLLISQGVEDSRGQSQVIHEGENIVIGWGTKGNFFEYSYGDNNYMLTADEVRELFLLRGNDAAAQEYYYSLPGVDSTFKWVKDEIW